MLFDKISERQGPGSDQSRQQTVPADNMLIMGREDGYFPAKKVITRSPE